MRMTMISMVVLMISITDDNDNNSDDFSDNNNYRCLGLPNLAGASNVVLDAVDGGVLLKFCTASFAKILPLNISVRIHMISQNKNKKHSHGLVLLLRCRYCTFMTSRAFLSYYLPLSSPYLLILF